MCVFIYQTCVHFVFNLFICIFMLHPRIRAGTPIVEGNGRPDPFPPGPPRGREQSTKLSNIRYSRPTFANQAPSDMTSWPAWKDGTQHESLGGRGGRRPTLAVPPRSRLEPAQNYIGPPDPGRNRSKTTDSLRKWQSAPSPGNPRGTGGYRRTPHENTCSREHEVAEH